MKWLDYRLQHERMRRVVPYVTAGARVLDIACADGALFRLLDGRLGAGVGIDLDPVPASSANFTFIQGSFPSALPAGEPFDLVVALAVVEHIPQQDQPAFAQGCARHMRSGAWLIVTVPSSRVDDLLHVMKALRLVDGMRDHQHYGFDPRKAIPLFEQAGLRLERHSTFELGLNHLLVFRKP